MRISGWNVKTLLVTGNSTKIVKELETCEVKLIALPKIRYMGNREINKKDFKYFVLAVIGKDNMKWDYMEYDEQCIKL